jgi:hypothetical protein
MLAAELEAEIAESLAHHKAVCRQVMALLGALPEESRRSAFDTFRQNYFFRTATTPESVARVLLAAAQRLDVDTMAEVAFNIYQEGGSGKPAAAHVRLLERSHNRLAADVHDLPPLLIADVDDVDTFPLVVAATREFRLIQHELYSSDDYCLVLGASYAQEAAAVDMLQAVLDFLFAPHADRYPAPEYADLIEYFTCHLNGVEEEHARNAWRALDRNVKTTADARSALKGAQRFLAVQCGIWTALADAFVVGAR